VLGKVVKVTYEILDRKFETEAFDNLLLTNELGGFFFFSNAPFSKNQGFFFNEDMQIYKTIEAIRLYPYENLTEVKNKFYAIEQKRNKINESFFLPKRYDVILYEHDSDRKIEINLDCRKAYDSRIWGRYYEISIEEKAIVIHFTKKTDEKEDSTNGNAEFEIFIAIAADNLEYELVDKWYDQFYPYDFERNENPQRSIYQAIRMNAKKIAVSCSKNRHDAIRNAKYVFTAEKTLRGMQKSALEKSAHKKINNSKVDIASLSSIFALNSFIVKSKIEGIYAGLPWFFQFWTRDSAICCKALMLNENYALAKKILMNYIDYIREDGWMPNIFPSSGADSADAVGLVFFRINELIEILENKKIIWKYFTKGEIRYIEMKLENAIYSIMKNHSSNGFILNGKKETWMDTLPREGIRIEIQALHVVMCSLLKKLAKMVDDKISHNFARQQEDYLIDKTRKYLFKEYLLDGLNDEIARPNVFLAYYICPDLLSSSKWEKTFDFVLPRLWLEWGGLSSIDKSNPEFQSRHTGVNDKSYHKGDSWYYINNLAAISMHRLNRKKYKEYIEKIFEASTNEILSKGILGYHAELSSAEIQESKGCLAQAWSSAIYIELLKEILDKI
jgi:glycogen debranching enzyme